MRLYEIANNYRRVLDMVKEGEIPEEAIVDTIEMIEGELNEKMDAIICVYKELIAEEAAIKVEAAALKYRAEDKAKAASRLLEYVQNQMQKMDVKKIETSKNEISIKKKPPKVVIGDAERLYALRPDLFVVKTPEPSKTAISALLKMGEEVPECWLEQTYRVAVK